LRLNEDDSRSSFPQMQVGEGYMEKTELGACPIYSANIFRAISDEQLKECTLQCRYGWWSSRNKVISFEAMRNNDSVCHRITSKDSQSNAARMTN
jgi:hypothetical protein